MRLRLHCQQRYRLIEVVINQDDKVWPMVAPGAAIEDSFDEKDQENRIQN